MVCLSSANVRTNTCSRQKDYNVICILLLCFHISPAESQDETAEEKIKLDEDEEDAEQKEEGKYSRYHWKLLL